MNIVSIAQDFSEFMSGDTMHGGEAGKGAMNFRSVLSFEKLIEHIRNVALTGNKYTRLLAGSILKDLGTDHPLLFPVRDIKDIEEYRELISGMMAFAFPEAFYQIQTYAATLPFTDEFFYFTPAFARLALSKELVFTGERNIGDDAFRYGKAIAGFSTILRTFYGAGTVFTVPLIYKIPDPETGLDRHYKMNLANEFLYVHADKPPKELTRAEVEEASARIYDLQFISGLIDPGDFEFRGFLIVNLINVTDPEIVSDIKNDLIKRDSLTNIAGFLKLQHKLRSLLRCPDMLIGLAGIDRERSSGKFSIKKVGHSFLSQHSTSTTELTDPGSIYGRCYTEKKIVICGDLALKEELTALERTVLESGITNTALAPLIYEEEFVGILELFSPSQGIITAMNAIKLQEALPLIALAVSEIRKERNGRIQAIIKDKCTAIHNCLEWRFYEAAAKVLDQLEEGNHAEMEEIVFKDVYPLYGLSDIRNSTMHRSNAIRDDLIANLRAGTEAIREIQKTIGNVVLDQVLYKAEKKTDELMLDMDAGAEQAVVNLIKNEIEPALKHFSQADPLLKGAYEKYELNIDPKVGMVYKRRKEYEESVTMLTESISAYLDKVQPMIQREFPHYFERFKTDGVDHTIYVGQSLVNDRTFSLFNLRNLRLWQLKTVCEIAARCESILPKLRTRLETAHLILIQNTPLAIRFRYDEKKFDVDGAYNVRYEIMKKRIDKAAVRGTEERLVQPGKIALIYSQEKEIADYHEFIGYLSSKKYLRPGVEELELEELQGIANLKALRIEVNTPAIMETLNASQQGIVN